VNASRTAGLLATLSLAGLGLAACGAGGGTSSAGTTSSSAASSSSSGGTATAAALKTASTSLGTVVVDSAGKTVYAFDKDTKNSGTSACSGACAGLWPAVTTTAGSPTVTGVTGTIGTITRSDGTKQITLDGRPLYTYSGDTKAGAVAGEGVKGIWWAVSPAGAEVSAAPSVAGY
jgi:predicted lipoprotein with Yx(FWY)xxD motif